MGITLFRFITQRVVVITDVSGLRIGPFFKTIKMRLIGCPETSVEYCHYSERNNQEERSSKKIICDIERPPTVSFVGRNMVTYGLSNAFEKNALRLMFTAVKHRCTFP
jgi:hypothetical protein